MKIKLLSRTAVIPTKGSPGSAGYDLYSPIDVTLKKGIRELIKTGVAFSDFEEGTYGRIAPRSSLGFKGIDVLAGVVDSDYRGDVGVILISHMEDYEIKTGDRIAQVIFEKCVNVVFEEVSELDSTLRSDGGYGSTGK